MASEKEAGYQEIGDNNSRSSRNPRRARNVSAVLERNQGNNKRKITRRSMAMGAMLVLVSLSTGGIILGVHYIGFNRKRTLFTYNMGVTGPFDRQLCLNALENVTIAELNFTTNVNIQNYTFPTNFTLFNNGTDSNGFYHYQITMANVSFPLPVFSNTTTCFNYTFSPGTTFINQIGLHPQNLNVTLGNGQVTQPAIDGAQPNAENPSPHYIVDGVVQSQNFNNITTLSSLLPLSSSLNRITIVYQLQVNETTGEISSLNPAADNLAYAYISNLTDRYPYISTHLSIGGSCYSSDPLNYQKITSSPEALSNTTNNIVAFMQIFNVNGFIINDEYWHCDQTDPYGLPIFASAMRATFGANQKALTQVVPVGQDNIQKLPYIVWHILDTNVNNFALLPYPGNMPSNLNNFLVRLNISDADPTRNTTAGTYTIVNGIETYAALNLNVSKFYLFMPAVAQINHVLTLNNGGYGQVIDTNYPTTFVAYSDIVNRVGPNVPLDTLCLSAPRNPNGYAPWCYSRGEGETFSYIDRYQLIFIDNYVITQNLAGVSFVPITNDVPLNGTNSLLNTTITLFGNSQTPTNNDTTIEIRHLLSVEEVALTPETQNLMGMVGKLLKDVSPELYDAFVGAAKNGLLLGFLTTLMSDSVDGLEAQLKAKGWSDHYIQAVKIPLNAAITGLIALMFPGTGINIVLRTGVELAVLATGGTHEDASTIANTVSSVASVVTVPLDIVTTTVAVVGGYVGSTVGKTAAQLCSRFGSFAYRYFSGPSAEDNHVIEKPQQTQAFNA